MMKKEIKEEFQWKNVGHQYFAVIAVNLLMLNHGAIMAWITPTILILMSKNTPLVSGPLSNEDVSWLGSIGSIGALFGTFTFGYLMSYIESKRTTLSLALPYLIFWLLIYFGITYAHILLARFLAGWAAGGIQVTVVLFTSEIANNNIRGKLGSLGQLSRNIGMLVCFIVGSTLEYPYIPCIFVSVPIAFGLIFIFLPNTPQFHLRRGQIEEANKALKYYKGYEGKSLAEDIAINSEFQRIKSVVEHQKIDEKAHISDNNRNALKAIFTGIMLSSLTNATAYFTLMSYAVPIFQKCGTYLNPYYSSVMLAVAQIIGSLCSTQLADTLGRKILMIVSLLGSAIGMTSLAVYIYLMELGFDLKLFVWLPVISLSFVIFISTAGIVSLASICIVEILPPKIRNVGLNLSVFSNSVTAFLSSKSFPIWMETIGLDVSLLMYATICFVGVLYVVCQVDETKRKSMDEVISTQRNSTNV